MGGKAKNIEQPDGFLSFLIHFGCSEEVSEASWGLSWTISEHFRTCWRSDGEQEGQYGDEEGQHGHQERQDGHFELDLQFWEHFSKMLADVLESKKTLENRKFSLAFCTFGRLGRGV